LSEFLGALDFETYARIALDHGVGIVLEAPTWRANADWAAKLGYDAAALADANRLSIGLLLEIRDQFETPGTPVVISGNIGPASDPRTIRHVGSGSILSVTRCD
jgi:hypothetical protein